MKGGLSSELQSMGRKRPHLAALSIFKLKAVNDGGTEERFQDIPGGADTAPRSPDDIIIHALQGLRQETRQKEIRLRRCSRKDV